MMHAASSAIHHSRQDYRGKLYSRSDPADRDVWPNGGSPNSSPTRHTTDLFNPRVPRRIRKDEDDDLSLLYRIVGIFLTVIALAGIGTYIMVHEGTSEQYTIVLDAGSTGTRIHVFCWELDASKKFNLLMHFQEKMGPGISTFRDNPVEAGISLSALFEIAKKKVPPPQYSSTRVVFWATAGLRLLEKEGKAEPVLESVRNFIENDTPFLFFRRDARIIRGDEEGLYGWLTVNFLNRALRGHPENSVGIIDLGGASTQLVFEVGNPSSFESGGDVELQSIIVNGEKEKKVFTESYLGYGLQVSREAFFRYYANYLLPFPTSSSSTTSSLSSSSTPTSTSKGASSTSSPSSTSATTSSSPTTASLTTSERRSAVAARPIKVQDVSRREVMKGDSFENPCYPAGHVMTAMTAEGIEITLEGTGNFTTCADMIDAMMRAKGTFRMCVEEPCLPRDVALPSMMFYGFSYIFDRTRGLGLDIPYHTTVRHIRHAAEEFCSFNTHDLRTVFKEGYMQPENFCFDMAYVCTLLSFGYGFGETRPFVIIDKLEKMDVSWALGAAIHMATGKNVEEGSWLSSISNFFSTNSLSVSSILISVVGLSLLVIVFYSIRMRRRKGHKRSRSDESHLVI